MVTDATEQDRDYQELLGFLYRAPVGLLQASVNGDIELLNPMSSQLLMPLVRDAALDNLFQILDPVCPQLRALSANAREDEHEDAVVCDALRVRVAPHAPGRSGSVLSLSVLKVQQERLIAVLFDVTREVLREQELLARRLTGAGLNDALTQLPNRPAARNRLERAFHRMGRTGSRGVALMFLNADRFHQVNDAFGAEVGNALLAGIATRIRAFLVERRHAVAGDHGGAPFPARVGADEFVVILDDVANVEPVAAFSRDLLERLVEPIEVRGKELRCSFSLGIALDTGTADPAAARDEDHRRAEDLLQNAGTAMAVAKRAGGGRVAVFEPEMRRQVEARAGIEGELRLALRRKELYVAYQPLIALDPPGAPPSATGLEALLRWKHPSRGSVPPGEFIGIAEECGLIHAVGEFVLETACRQFIDWQQRLGDRAPGSIAVNLSRAQLREPGWVARLATQLQLIGMRPEQLHLELTESLAAQDLGIQTALRELKQLGVRVALDDFGTGYSSLSSLHLFPVDTVKIDRSFMVQIETSPHHQVLVTATVMVAKSLGMRTVAEGIETPGQLRAARDSGCDAAQGYLFSPPLPVDECETWLATRRPLSD